MQTVNYPTSHVIIRANTTSQWGHCSFAIIFCSNDWKKRLAKRYAQLPPLQTDTSFYSLIYWDNAVRFFRHPFYRKENAPNINDILDENSIWSFITLSEDEIAQFVPTIDILNYAQLVIGHNGLAKFISWGERSTSQYVTESFFVEDILA